VSVEAIALVYKRTRAKGARLNALVAIADHAHDDGRQAFPSPATIAWKGRITLRAAELIVQKLVDTGEVWPRYDAAAKRLYLDIRCICHWDAYQREGPIPSRKEPVRARAVREDFARKLVAAAERRAVASVSRDDSALRRDDTLRERENTLGEPAPVEISVSPPQSGRSTSQPSGTVRDPSVEPSKEKAGAAPRHTLRDVEKPGDNLGVITKLAHEVLELQGPRAPIDELTEAVKYRCARLHVAYDSATVAKAIDSAKWQREHRAPARAS